MEKSLASTGGKLSSIGAKLTTGLSLPLIAVGAGLVKVGKDFDDAADSIRAATGATGKQLESLSLSFKNVLATVPASMGQTAIAIGDLHTRTGLTGVALETMATQMLNLSRLTNSDLAPLIATTTRLFGDWSIATGDQSAALDFLFRTSQSTGIEVSRLSDLVVQFGAPLRALGFEFEQAAAMMGKWEKEGVNIETVLSGLRFALGNFAKQGLDPASALQGVITAIQNAKTESEATAIAFQVFGKRAAIDMSRAIQEGRFNIDGLVTSLKTSKETINGAAAATLSLGERMQLLGNRVMVAVEPIATRLVGGLERLAIAAMPVVDVLAKLVVLFTNLPSSVQTGVIGFLAFGAALGPLVYVAGTVTSALGALIATARLAGPAIAGAFGSAAVGTTVAWAGAIIGVVDIVGQLIGRMKELWGIWSRFGAKGLMGELGRVEVPSGFKGGDLPPGGGAYGAPRPGFTGKDIHLPYEGPSQTVEDQIKRAMGLPTGADISKLFKPEKEARVNPFSGSDIFKDAAQAMRDIAQVGGITRLTADETQRLNGILSTALDKYGALGRQAPDAMVDLWAATMPRPEVVEGIDNIVKDLGTLVDLPVPPIAAMFGQNVTSGLPGGLPGTNVGLPQLPDLPGFFSRAFGSLQGFGAGLSQTIMGALQGGGNLAGSIAGFLGSGLTSQLSEMLGSSLKNATGGFLKSGLGQLLGGSLSAILPGLGALMGPLIEKVGGFFKNLFGGGKGRATVEEFAKSFGGFDSLHTQLLTLGDAGEALWKKFTQGVGRNNPEQAKAVIDEITAAFANQQEVIRQSVGNLTSGVNARAANIGGQGDMNVVGAGAVASFALQIQQGASALAAFQNITPAVTAMQTALAAGNVTVTESVQRLLDLGGILEANSIQFTNLGASGEILSAMLQGNIRDGALFAAVATDIGTQIQTVIDRGVPMAQVFALSQPQLQALWEAQQKWGFAVDDTTGALLKEAEAQGFVGAAMKSVNQQILDVLVAIGRVLGADIPAALSGLPAAAQAAADGMNQAFGGVRVPSLSVEGPDTSAVDTTAVPQMAMGGIVRARPGGTLVNVGEGGRDEAIIPLDGARRGGSQTNHISFPNLTVDSEERVEQVAMAVARRIYQGGAVRTQWSRALQGLT